MPTRPGLATQITGALVCALVLIGIAYRDVPVPRLAFLAPITYFVAALGNAGMAAVLWATWNHPPARRSSFVLALSFAICAVFSAIALLVLPMLPGSPPVISAAPQTGVWIYIAWHAAAAIGALAYVAFRRDFDGALLTRPFKLIAGGIAAAILVVTVTLAFAGGTNLPGASLGGLSTSGAAPYFAALLAVACFAAFRIRAPSTIDRALALSLLALGLDSVLIAVGHRFTGSYYAGRTLLMLGALLVFAAAVKTLVESRLTLGVVEARLTHVEGESAMRAARIRALWEIASDASTSDHERFARILQIATAAIRPGLPLLGTVSHLDGDAIVIDATAWTMAGPAADELAKTVHPGATFPFDRTLLSLLHAGGTTRAWDDLGFLEGRGMFAEGPGWRSFIGTPLTIARRTYFVTFTSPETTIGEPFAEHDVAFVDVVASFFASRFLEQMQYARIQFQIEHDVLTGLENRVQFRRRIREEIQGGSSFAVAFVNLDGFRHVNEREGHQIGDEILVAIAAGLKAIDERNVIARTSGDEFGILIPGAGSTEAAASALDHYGGLFREPFHLGEHERAHVLTVGASIGAARFPADGRTAEELMRRADVALSIGKERGGSAVMLFDRRMEAILEETALRVVELTDAIANGELALVYQPTFDLASREIRGAEALVRWDHPVRGRLPPAEFIGFAERNGLMGALSRWVLDRLVADLSGVSVLPPGFRVYFNLSAGMLENFAFISRLNEVLRAAPDIVSRIGVEVTETAAMQNVERSMSTIDLFRSWGLSVAIDDFGTGYSSLSYLKQLRVDVIKLDKSFVDGLPGDERDAALAEMLIRITNRFGFATLAEGIETEAQASWLLEHGCRLGQGYLIAKPQSFDALLLGIGHASAA